MREALAWSLFVSAGVALVTFAFFIFFIRKVWQARRQPVLVGDETMVGSVGQVRQELAPEGLVFVKGALWKASADKPVPVGSAVRVIGRQGLELQVAPENGQSETKEKG